MADLETKKYQDILMTQLVNLRKYLKEKDEVGTRRCTKQIESVCRYTFDITDLLRTIDESYFREIAEDEIKYFHDLFCEVAPELLKRLSRSKLFEVSSWILDVLIYTLNANSKEISRIIDQIPDPIRTAVVTKMHDENLDVGTYSLACQTAELLGRHLTNTEIIECIDNAFHETNDLNFLPEAIRLLPEHEQNKVLLKYLRILLVDKLDGFCEDEKESEHMFCRLLGRSLTPESIADAAISMLFPDSEK